MARQAQGCKLRNIGINAQNRHDPNRRKSECLHVLDTLVPTLHVGTRRTPVNGGKAGFQTRFRHSLLSTPPFFPPIQR